MCDTKLSGLFPEARTNDLGAVFRSFRPGELPLEQAVIKTETDFENLGSSMTELGSGILLAVYAGRCCNPSLIFRPLDQRSEELEDYRKRSCIFRRNGDPNSNFFTVTADGDGTVWVHNAGKQSLRFQTPDGRIYRVCAGYTEALVPSNLQAQVAPVQVLLDLNNGLLDLQVSAVHVRYGESSWQRGGVDCLLGSRVDSYFCRVFCGDDCLGVLESYSGYFLERPQLELLDTGSYGPTQWFVRNRGNAALTLRWPNDRAANVPADGNIYRLETLVTIREEENV